MAFKVVLTVVAFIIATQLIENAIRLNEGTKRQKKLRHAIGIFAHSIYHLMKKKRKS